ncbi:hypothetical protein EYF80_057311 [Liparis tanakae]|uniref:Uncharacterized protein n=1 Tax=Liparis tanakae TaxID=230148 RepID=A0A4Z2EVG1_9TELE|nr:hypothetical protein EYF80_057311 [Liparis tanakae]
MFIFLHLQLDNCLRAADPRFDLPRLGERRCRLSREGREPHRRDPPPEGVSITEEQEEEALCGAAAPSVFMSRARGSEHGNRDGSGGFTAGLLVSGPALQDISSRCSASGSLWRSLRQSDSR